MTGTKGDLRYVTEEDMERIALEFHPAHGYNALSVMRVVDGIVGREVEKARPILAKNTCVYCGQTLSLNTICECRFSHIEAHPNG